MIIPERVTNAVLMRVRMLLLIYNLKMMKTARPGIQRGWAWKMMVVRNPMMRYVRLVLRLCFFNSRCIMMDVKRNAVRYPPRALRLQTAHAGLRMKSIVMSSGRYLCLGLSCVSVL